MLAPVLAAAAAASTLPGPGAASMSSSSSPSPKRICPMCELSSSDEVFSATASEILSADSFVGRADAIPWVFSHLQGTHRPLPPLPRRGCSGLAEQGKSARAHLKCKQTKFQADNLSSNARQVSQGKPRRLSGCFARIPHLLADPDIWETAPPMSEFCSERPVGVAAEPIDRNTRHSRDTLDNP
eukprot:365717-Chlamydomonas_euryale.AAC.6